MKVEVGSIRLGTKRKRWDALFTSKWSQLTVRRWSRRLGLAAVLLLVVAACGTPIAGESWAGLSTDSAGRYVYVAYSEQVFRIDPQAANDPVTSNNKHIEWLSQAPGKTHMYPPPALSDSALYSGAFDGKLYAFNLKGGALSSWVPPATGSGKLLGAATLDKNILYQGMGNDGIRAYNPVTGQEIASYKGTKYGVWSAPVVVNDTVYFTSLDHYLYALTSGTLLYKWQVDLGGTAADSPVYDKSTGMLYAGTYSDEVVAVDTNQNPPRVVHRFATSNWVWGSPVLDQGTLYFGDLNGILYALDTKTWTLKWPVATHGDEVGGFRGRLAIVNNAKPTGSSDPVRLILGGSENKRVYAYNADTGALAWTSALMSDKILSNLLVLNNDVIFATQDENQLVVALNTNTGQLDWQVSLKAEITRFAPTPQSP